MAVFTTNNVVIAVREIASTTDRLSNPSNVDQLKLSLDCINQMLVTLDVPDEFNRSWKTKTGHFERTASVFSRSGIYSKRNERHFGCWRTNCAKETWCF